MCRVTMGHLRVTIGHLRVTIIGHLRVTIGYFFSISKYKANTTELHLKVRQTCLVSELFNQKPTYDQPVSKQHLL